VRPVLFVTGVVPEYRVAALERLHEREEIMVALFGGRAKHGGPVFNGSMPFPCRHVHPRELYGLARSGSYRAVIAPTGGRMAPLATWAGARRARVPLILWASLWAHPRTAAHALTYLPLRRLYRSADAVVTYGSHVSAYVGARGASNVFIAAQSVDNDFWRTATAARDQTSARAAGAPARFLYVGRDAPEKGIDVLLEAWRLGQLAQEGCSLVLAGVDGGHHGLAAGAAGHASAITCIASAPPEQLRGLYAGSDVLVVPSVRTRTFREPWGLVVNEAMNAGVAVIASDEVGAVAGGLVRDGLSGMVVPAADAARLADAMRRLAADAQLRARLADAGRAAVLANTHDAWARGFSDGLAAVGCSLGRW
jgi:glycosyltransferase involved in cell wall biosynthesis